MWAVYKSAKGQGSRLPAHRLQHGSLEIRHHYWYGNNYLSDGNSYLTELERYWEACSSILILLGQAFKPHIGIETSLALLVINGNSNVCSNRHDTLAMNSLGSLWKLSSSVGSVITDIKTGLQSKQWENISLWKGQVLLSVTPKSSLTGFAMWHGFNRN